MAQIVDTLTVVGTAKRATRHVFDGEVNPFLADPTMYSSLYSSLPAVDPKNASSYLLTAREKAKRPVIRKDGKECLPGADTFNPVHRSFLTKFSQGINDHFGEPSFDEDGFTTNGMHTTGESMMTIAGYPQEPVSALPKSNKGERERLELGEKLTQRQKDIARAVWGEVWSHIKLSSIKVPRLSTSGPIRDVTDANWKIDYALAMQNQRVQDRQFKLIESGDSVGLYRDYEIAFLMGVNVRWQPDMPGKQRYYWSIEDVLASESPVRRPITTVVNFDGVDMPQFAAMRTRLINQGSWAINVQLQPYATGCMHGMFARYPETWHRDEDNLHNELEGKEVYFSDVSTYDQTFTEEMIDITHDTGREYISEGIMSMSQHYYYSAYFARPMVTKGGTWESIGNPALFKERQVVAGNRSGHAFTSLLAKVWKVIESLWAFDCIGYDVVRDVKLFLAGKMPCGTINNGDDAIDWFDLRSDYDKYVAFRNSKRADWMFKVEREYGNIFSGRVFMRVPGHRTKYTQLQRITTPFQKIYIPERSIGGDFRPFWPIGIVQRVNSSDSHPSLAAMWDIHNKVYSDTWGKEIGDFWTIVKRAHEAMPFNSSAYTAKDIIVQEDPAKIHYAYTDDEIADEVIDRSFARLHHRFFEPSVQHNYSGTFL